MNDEIAELLPLYANGQLSTEQRDKVEEAIQNDSSIQDELAFWQGVQQSIRNDEIPSPAEWGLAQLKRAIEQQSNTPAKKATSRFWKPLAIAASFLFVVQTAYWGSSYFQVDQYQTLSSSVSANTVQVQFKEGVTEMDLRDLLVTLNGVIVGGPSALGIYTVRFDDAELALTKLQESQLVDYVEQTE